MVWTAQPWRWAGLAITRTFRNAWQIRQDAVAELDRPLKADQNTSAPTTASERAQSQDATERVKLTLARRKPELCAEGDKKAALDEFRNWLRLGLEARERT
jgi:hypothetical protein